MKPSKFVIILSLVLTCVAHMCREVLAADGPATRPSAKIVSSDPLSTSIEIPIAAGQYYFAAYGTDAASSVEPMLRSKFTSNGRIRFTFIPGRMEEEGDQKFWRVKLVQELDSGGVQPGVSGGVFTFRNGIKSDASKVTSADIPVVIDDVSRSAGLSGIALYRFPYAKIGEEVRFVVVAVSDKPAIFPMLFSMPSYPGLDWTKWFEVK